MPLFSHRQRNDPSPQRMESAYALLDRVDDPVFERVRTLVEEWFAHYPEVEEKRNLRGRLVSGDDRHFVSAFWELYLHEVYMQLGFDVEEVEPAVPGSTKRPDFLLRRGMTRFYLEAVTLGETGEEIKKSRLLDAIEQSLNKVESDDFFLLFGVETYGEDSPSARRLRPALEKWLASLDWDDVRRAHDADPFSNLPEKPWQEGDWVFSFRALPKSVELRGRPDVRPVGMGPIRARYVDDRDAIVHVSNRKAKRYGQLDLPFVLAVNVNRITGDQRDFNAALFGQEAIRPVSPNSDEWEPVRRPNGLWFGPRGFRNGQVTAVLGALRLHAWTVARDQPQLWVHPDASSPGDDLGPWDRYEVDREAAELIRHAGTFAPTDTLRLPGVEHFESRDEWPGAPFQ